MKETDIPPDSHSEPPSLQKRCKNKKNNEYSTIFVKNTFQMEIFITNDDGYQAKGIRILTETMRQFGSVTVIAPKYHQSGMSMAVSLGLKQIAYKELLHEDEVRDSSGNLVKGALRTAYLDATPASCIKFGLNTCFLDKFPDVVVSGINHGSNAASASCYSGTLGAALEGALNGIPAVGVSLDSMNPDADFSAVEKYFPDIFRTIISNLPEKKGIIYNVNFPDIPAEDIKGVRVGVQGKGRWVREFCKWNPTLYERLGLTPEMLGQKSEAECEEGEELYMMTGDFLDDPSNPEIADHWLMKEGYVSVTAHNIDTTDREETVRLGSIGINKEF